MIALKFSSKEAVVINLNDRIGQILKGGYFPQSGTSGKTVTETIHIQARGSIEAVISILNRLFLQARSTDPAIERVYINFAIREGLPLWRSRIYNGAVNVTAAVGAEYPKGRVTIEISFERDPFWEGAEEVVILSNANGTSASGPLPVFNANDGVGSAPAKRVNYADIAIGAIQGDLPSPLKLVMVNQWTRGLAALWIGLNSTRPADLTSWSLEAESAIGITPVINSAASGGAYATGSMNYGQEKAVLSWELPDSLITAMRGQRMRMLLRPIFVGGLYSVFKYKLVISQFVQKLYETDWLRESASYAMHWLDLFDLRMPPWLEGETNLMGLRLELWLSLPIVGTFTWSFDDVMLFPEDSFVSLVTYADPNEKVVLDGINGRNWCEDTNGKKVGLRKLVGDPLMLIPGAMHRFYFAMHEIYMNSAPIGQYIGVTASYRPRRATL